MEETTDTPSLPKIAGRRVYSILSALIVITFITPYISKNAYALEKPQPLYPYNGAITTPESDPPLGVPSFAWSPIAGANVYRLQVDNESTFSPPLFLDITTHNAVYSPAAREQLIADGDWYWRVRVEDPLPYGDWSTVFRFTKTWATYESRPQLLNPTDGETLAFFDAPAFTWAPTLGAASYLFQVAANQDGFSVPLLSVNTLAPAYQPTERLSNSIYYWRVVPLDVAGHQGMPSDIQSFETIYGSQLIEGMVPSLLSPQDESTHTFTPAFHWSAVMGAEHYLLEFTSDNSCDFSSAMQVETHQTTYTPVATIPDAFRYCWRVRAESGQAIGDWSAIWHFNKVWHIKPTLLTPTNLYPTGLYPIYSWTPVPGASHYLIQISQNPDFTPIFEEGETANTTYSPQSKYDGTSYYYWRVWPIDGGGLRGTVSDVGEFQSLYYSLAPILIYPLYYYPTGDFSGTTLNPHEDRTAAYPVFMWHRVIAPAPIGGIGAMAYRLQVDDSPYFDSIDWQYDTENTSASPTAVEPFAPGKDVTYYWRVCPLTSLYDGDCENNPENGSPWWSQVWNARFDESLRLAPTNGNLPELLRPVPGQDSVEATPLFEWWPMEDVVSYQIQVSRDADFSSTEITQTINIPAYSPKISLAQRSLDRTSYGTFYWRVRGLKNDSWTDWSESWRFQIAAQSEWRASRTLGNPENKLLIGNDPAGDAPLNYDLTTLYASQSKTDWYIGFSAILSTADMTYVLYLDLDNIEGSGAGAPPVRDYQVSTSSEHRPECAVFVDVVGGIINPQNTWVFAWNGNQWETGVKLSDLGGDVYYSSGYAELEIPASAIGLVPEASSASVMLFSVNNSDARVQDTVPSDPSVPGSAVLTRFSAVSDRMNLIYPPGNSTGDPTLFTSVLPFYWDWPTGSNGATPFAGMVLQIDLDRDFTPPHEVTFQINSSTTYFSEHNITLLNDILGDENYYWRVRPRYMLEGYPEAFGAWTGGGSFQRKGFTVKNLTTSTQYSSLSFSWDMAEGADAYRVQVAANQDFDKPGIDITTPISSYSSQDSLAPGLYYWRVQIRRYGNIYNEWAYGEPFEVSLPSPSGLLPKDGQALPTAPTFCWDPLVIRDDLGNAVLTAWKYQVQISTDPGFGFILDSTGTNNHCWTPTRGYLDGSYYWRVAMLDGNGQIGPYSQVAQFTKHYPSPALVSPKNGYLPATPTFFWNSVDGAAEYVVEVSHYPNFSPVVDAVETISTQYTPTKVYDTNRVYYWRVAIRDLDGAQGAYSQARFIIGQFSFSYMPVLHKWGN